MDLRFLDARPTDAEREAVDALLGPPESGWDGGERGQDDRHVAFGGWAVAQEVRPRLLPALHAVNDRVGWVSQGALNYIAQRLNVPPAEVYGVLTFYALLSPTPRPPRVVHVCVDLACRAQGSGEMLAALGPEGEPTEDDRATWQRSPCLGLCERAPAAMVVEAGAPSRVEVLAPAAAEDILGAIAGLAPNPRAPTVEWSVPQRGDPALVLLRRIGRVDPASLADYRANGGYTALRRALDLGPAGVIREVVDSKLQGRGGAAFPTGRKWDAVAGQPVRPHHLVCNADESEPGTFKDRVIMEGDPYAVVEAMTIAGFATGCERGYVYLRGEYPAARRRLEHAIEEARRHGFLGHDVMGSGLRFDVEVFRGAGAYICGEETAIFNSIEGFRGEPRNKPPFPVEIGLFGQPTLVNNVETLVNVLPIMEMGGPAYAAIGTGHLEGGSTGPKLFCLSGRVQRPGVYEIPFGATLAELLALAGGVPEGRELRAVLLGGAAGTFVRPDALDLPLTFEGTRAAGASLGSGVVMVLDDTVELVPFLLRIAAFFRDESCGQCVPCRVGTVRQQEALQRLAGNGRDPAEDLGLLADLGRVMRDASICGLGQTASSAVESAIAQLGVFRS